MSRPLPRWSEITAVFGGTFDPPHLGHREAVRGLFSDPGVARVWVIPSGQPPHKAASELCRPQDRLEMARLNFSSHPGDPFPPAVTIDSREIERSERSERPSYTYDTLLELGREIGQLAFVVGADQLRDLRSWYRFPEILGLCHWIVLARKPQGEELARKTLQGWSAQGLCRTTSDPTTWQLIGEVGGDRFLKLVPTEAPALSSTAIRERLGRTGEPPEGSLHPEVLSYLKSQRLYGTGGL